jgi:hypothetical protein
MVRKFFYFSGLAWSEHSPHCYSLPFLDSSKDHTCKSVKGGWVIVDGLNRLVFVETKCCWRSGPRGTRVTAVCRTVWEPTASPTLSTPQAHVVSLTQTRVLRANYKEKKRNINIQNIKIAENMFLVNLHSYVVFKFIYCRHKRMSLFVVLEQ